MLTRFTLSIAAALALCPGGVVEDPAGWEFEVTRDDVIRLMTQARARQDVVELPLIGSFGFAHQEHQCTLDDPEGQDAFYELGSMYIWLQEDDEDERRDKDGVLRLPNGKIDPKHYQYPFPKDVSEAAQKALKKLDDDTRTIFRRRKPYEAEITRINDEYRELTSSIRNNAYPWYRIAQNCQGILEFDEAKDAIKRARKIDPKSAALLTEEGDIHRWHSDYKRARKSYDAAVGADPKFALAFANRAVLSLMDRDFEKAKQDLDAAKAIDPDLMSLKRLYDQLEGELNNNGFTGDNVDVYESKNYKIVSYSRPLAKLVAAHAEAILDYYEERFPKVNMGGLKFPVYLYKTHADYIKAGAPRNSGGYYSPLVRKLVLPVQRNDKWKPGMKPDDGVLKNTLLVLYHEGFHQFMHQTLERAPQWFNEGHGDFYGGARWDPKMKRPGGIGYFRIGSNEWRRKLVQQMVKAGRYTETERFMKMTQQEMYANGGPNYAQAWSIVHFLHKRPTWGKQLLVPYYKQLRKGLGLREAYKKTFGRVNVDQFEEQWSEHVKGIRAP
ncbi:MAG: DUF1570 domain-containing protein [Planctomycetota bacterium]|jgi:tetratricopeptide (TPR) repeat protein